MNKLPLPFIIPENDINFRLGRLLTIISELSFNKRGNMVLTLDKIIVFDFLIKNPTVLYKLLKELSVQVELKQHELNNIDSLFIDKVFLLKVKPFELLVKIMVSRGFIMVCKKKQNLMYCISEQGKELVESFDSEYICRVRELTFFLKKLQGETASKIKKMITLTCLECK